MKNQKEIIEKIIEKLSNENKTISFAESCSGGRIASAFTAIGGVSSILNGSCVTYSNEIKEQWLGVEKKVLKQYGAVSSQCVTQMLKGIQVLAKSDYALAVSGIAGPSGGTDLKPVGTVYIGIKTPLIQEVFHCFFHGDREKIQEQSTDFAIKKLVKILEI